MKTYNLPPSVALALSTERIQFLSLLNDDDLRKQIDVQLIRDLIEDRTKFRAKVIKSVDALEGMEKQVSSVVRKYKNLQDFLEGKDQSDIDE